MRMSRFFVKLSYVILMIMVSSTVAMSGDKTLKMSTTTSTQASGLLDVLLPALEKDTGIKVKVIAKGTGAAIRDGIDGNVDVIFVHAKNREEKFVKDGFGVKRYAVMHNDFIILGPAGDPAKIKGMTDADVPIELKPLCEGDANLANPYGVIPINPQKHKHVQSELAKQFAQWLVSEKGQKTIADYRLHGKQLFYPDAVK